MDSKKLHIVDGSMHHMPWAYHHPKELHLSAAQLKDVSKRTNKGTDSTYTEGLVLDNNLRIVMTPYDFVIDIQEQTSEYFGAMDDALNKLPLNKITTHSEREQHPDIRVHIHFPYDGHGADIKTSLDRLIFRKSSQGFAGLRAR